MNTSPAIIQTTSAISINQRGAVIDDGATADEAIEAIKAAAAAASSCKFAIGDIANYLQGVAGVVLSEIALKTGLNASDLARASRTCQKIPFDSRTQLDFDFHAEAAKLPDLPEVTRWLQIAESEDLSRKRLRKSIELDRVATEDDLKPVTEENDQGMQNFGTLLTRLVILDGKLSREGNYDEMEPVQFYDLHRDFLPTLKVWARFVGRFKGKLPDFQSAQFGADMRAVMELCDGSDEETN